jgi:hypothetical protein
VEKAEIAMAQEPTFIVPVDAPPPPQRRGRKPGNGKIQNTLRLARRVGEGGWMVIPDQCAQSYYRIRKSDAEFRDMEIKIRKRPGVSGHDVYVKFPSGVAR